jgi:predicted metal-dependent phosphotriesterase family hydrolase
VIRTVLGDVEPGALGFCHAHDHVLIGDGLGARRNPDLLISDVDAAVAEVALFAEAGGGCLVDAMPLDSGRDPAGLVEVSRRTGVHLLATTGFHTRGYYRDGHWSETVAVDAIADLLVAEVEEGLDRHSYSGPVVERLEARAGLVKVATDEAGLDRRARRLIEAAALCHRRTGVAVLTHTEGGRGGLEQVELLQRCGVDPSRVLVSHVDRNHDRGYHRALAQTGAYLVYDGPSRTKYHTPEEVAELVGEACAAGGRARVLLGLDLALRSYRRSYGGEPGLAFVLDTFLPVLRAAGFGDDDIRAFGWDNPAAALDRRPA